jgi:hypothetical protein
MQDAQGFFCSNNKLSDKKNLVNHKCRVAISRLLQKQPSKNRTYSYNNVANKLEIYQTISINSIESYPGEKFIHLANNTVNASWQITYSGIGNL